MKQRQLENIWMVSVFTALVMLLPATIIISATNLGSDASMENSSTIPQIKILGTSNNTGMIQKTLSLRQISVSTINCDQIGNVKVGKDILLVDERGFSKASVSAMKKNIQDLVLKGVPILLVSDSNELLKSINSLALRDSVLTLSSINQTTNKINFSDSFQDEIFSAVYAENCSISGLKYDPITQVSATYGFVTDQNHTLRSDMINLSFSWALKVRGGLVATSDQNATTVNALSESSNNLVSTLTYSSEWVYKTHLTNHAGDGNHGYIYGNTNYYVLSHDGDTTYNFYRADYQVNIIPGTGYPEWYLADIWFNTGNLNDRGDIYPTRWLQDHGPSTDQGSGQVSYSISAQGPTFGYTYNMADADLHDRTVGMTPQKIGWWWNVNELSFGSYPRDNLWVYGAAVVRTQQAYQGYYQVMHDEYKAHWIAIQYVPVHWPIYLGDYTTSFLLSGRINPANPMS